ncbi:MAG: Epsin-3, clathrin recruitment and traffic between the Golgi and endosome [Tremellales sp. Tagirdzhanova-0007]|nr:MAG: Epsin-3, clathrin recruitment and traffic between the Golgi and endosome [Tremellales sp. Tagirdzhanova-0007]
MDYIEGLAKQASQLTMYDVKSYYNQARNMVLNVSEMESKVREATNDDPWGASSTLMQQIADATNNFAQFNEVMPTIYSRFMEKEAREWRQIYKALTLLEFLVKNGSERVVDDARAHVSTIKMLRSFHYIDEKGKDQGINVRNRASEIASLLGDVEKIRVERRKAKGNRSKYQGQGNDGGMSFITTGGSRYGGFGSESQSGGGGSYEGDGEFRSSSRGFRDQTGSGAEFDEYEGADDFDQPPRRSTSASASRTSNRPQPPPKTAVKPEKPVEKPKEMNLFDFDDDPTPAVAPSSGPVGSSAGDDEFDDFQQAPSMQPASPAASKPAGGSAGLFDLLGSTATAPISSSAAESRMPSLSSPGRAAPTSHAPNYSSMMSPSLNQPSNLSRPSYNSATSTPAITSPKAASASTFDDLWATSLTSLGAGTKANGTGASGTTGGRPASKTIQDLEKEKATNSLWGSGGSTMGNSVTRGPAKPAYNGGSGGGDDDLLL